MHRTNIAIKGDVSHFKKSVILAFIGEIYFIGGIKMTQLKTLEMIEERKRKNLLKKKIRKIFFHIIAAVAVEAAMISAIIYCIDNMTVYR